MMKTSGSAKCLVWGFSLALLGAACGSSSVTSGGGGTSGNGAGGGAGGNGGAAGNSAGGAGGGAGTCSEPVPCEGYDDGPDAHLAAEISCLAPNAVPANSAFTLAIYGHHLATGAGQYAIVTVGSGIALNGVPVTACHLDVQVPADQVAAPLPVSVVVSPGGWTLASAPATLSVR
jgi:hypothetical protein